MSQSEQTPLSLPISDDSAPQLDTQSTDAAPPTSDLDHSPSDSDTDTTLQQQLHNLELGAEEKNDGDEYGRSGEEEEKDNENEDENQCQQLLEEKNGGRSYNYPVRPEAEDCSYYMKTGMCKYGSNCKFNHPFRRRSQVVKEKFKEKDEAIDKPLQTECKYYMRTGGCKYGKGCRYNHSRAIMSAAPVLELNFLGLPIRPGERECPYYMRNGSCKYGANCKFNHPDPTAAGACDSPPRYVNGGSVTSQVASQASVASWLSPGTVNERATYVPMMVQPPEDVPSQNHSWNGYQAHVDPPERSMHPSTAYALKPSTDSSDYAHHQTQMLVDEFPERPGQQECSYFIKTGDCKFKSNCKFHHPKDRSAKASPCALSDKGLPLRPDQSTCSYYSRYGICKFGPACRYDHPSGLVSSTVPILDEPSSGIEEAGIAGGNTTDDATVQYKA